MEAAKEFSKVVELKPEDYERISNVGVAYRQAWRKQKAKLFHRKAVQFKLKRSIVPYEFRDLVIFSG